MNGYPRELHVDLSKLRGSTLKRYAWYYNIDGSSAKLIRPELASICAKHFMSHLEVDENQVLSNFEAYILNPNSAKRSVGSANGGLKRSGSGFFDNEPTPKKRKFVLIAENSLVAAKVNDNWILGRVIKYLKRKKMYKIEDADELTKDRPSFELSQDRVIGLPAETDLAGKRSFPKGCRVLARFPKTSTFYPATVVKRTDKKYNVRFDDDERDSAGNIRVMKIAWNEVVTLP